MIRIEGLCHGILAISYLTIPRGFTVVTGPNGSGKTTLLRLLAGICEPEEGSILVDGHDPSSTEKGFVQEFPGRNALFTLVLQEIASPLWFRHFSCEEIERSVSHAARSVGIEGLLLREVRTLSGGEQILCALATAVVANPTVLVLDEWDSHLDWETAAHVDACIREMHLPYVVRCTQDMDIAASADEVIFLDRGKVTFAGAPQAVFPPLISTCWYPPSWSLEEWNSSSTKYL